MRKEKSIETSELLVKGNIMSWEGMMIQLSNVSCVSTAPVEEIILIIGLVALTQKPIIGILLLAGGVAWIYGWYYFNNQRKSNTILSIVLNSGNNLQFIIGNKSFLDKVLQVLEQIIINGGVGGQSVTINIRGNKISGNASVLNDLNLS